MKNVRIILVEDDAFTRATLGDALTLHGFDVRARCANAYDAISAQEKFQPQVAVLDLDLGIGPTGIDVAISLRAKNPNIGIIFLTTYKDPRLIEHNLPKMPEGSIFLNKRDISSSSLISEQIELALLRPLMRRNNNLVRNNPTFSLSILQIEIMKQIAKGLSTSEIARSRAVSEQAIDKTINRISKHLGISKEADMNQRVQIVRAYFENKGKGE